MGKLFHYGYMHVDCRDY